MRYPVRRNSETMDLLMFVGACLLIYIVIALVRHGRLW